MSPDFVPIFQHEYRALRPRAPLPPISIRFRRFTSLNTTIRLREGSIHVSLSDLLEGAPESVLHAIAHIVEGLRKQTAETRILRDKTQAALDGLGA